MSTRRLADTAVAGLTLLAVLPLAVVFGGENLRWLEGGMGTLVLLVVVPGLVVGVLGGIVLAIARKKPSWLIATVSALCAGYLWLLVAMGMAIGHMH